MVNGESDRSARAGILRAYGLLFFTIGLAYRILTDTY
jgi:hypothetical protein